MHEGRIVGELVGDEITDEALVELSMKGNHKEEEA